MRVVHLSTYDITGGAARAAYRLNSGLQRLGHQSQMFVSSRCSFDRSVITFAPSMDMKERLRRRLRRKVLARDIGRYRPSRPGGYEPFSDDRTEYRFDLVKQLPCSDVLNLHWIAGYVDYHSLFTTVPASKPIVWTLHDMNPFTGGCHYDLDCGRYINHCGACPQLGSSDKTDLSHQIWRRKERVFSQVRRDRLHMVTPSRWLAERVKASNILGGFPLSVIPYGLDIEDFAPRDRRAARNVLGIPQEAKVVLFVADVTDNMRKGFALLAEALIRCSNKVANLFLVSLGHNKPAVHIQTPWLHVGPINNDRFLSMVYSAADIFTIPSLQDNLPNTVLEAMACGTPVVGFAVGGVPDMIREGVNGLLVSASNVPALHVAMVNLLNNAGREDIRANCRRVAVEEYSLELQARQYSELYKALI